MQTELLSPAGNFESVIQAIQNGTNAVYMGGQAFGARAFAENFSYDAFKEAIGYAHLYGVKIYATVNTLIYERETEAFFEHVKTLYELGADALIMQDIGMISVVSGRFPDIEIHASTQMHNHNDACLWFVRELGACRAVLAREMSLERIKNIKCEIDKEVFIHGALCICYSGQCLFSALTKDRSGNRGKCAQSCRMRYKLTDSKGNLLNNGGEYLLSPKDIGLFEDIGALLDAGVHSLKIEGRMKSPEYVGLVTKIYAGLLEQYHAGKPLKVKPKDTRDLCKLFNRGFTKGHLFEKRGSELMGTLRPNHKGTPLGVVLSAGHDTITIKLSSAMHQGDGIKFEQSDEGFICNKIYKNGKLVSGAEAGEVIQLDSKARVSRNETVVKTSDILLIKELKSTGQRKVPIKGRLIASVGSPLLLEISDGEHHVSAQGETAQQSRTSPTTISALSESISKLGDTPYVFERLQIDADEDIFVAKSQINALRRDAMQKLSEQRTSMPERRILAFEPERVRHAGKEEPPILHVLVRNAEQFQAIKEIVAGDIYTNDQRLYEEHKNACRQLRLKTDKLSKSPPPFKDERLLVTDHGGIHAYQASNDIVLDYSLNALNSYTLSYLMRFSAKRIALSPELNVSDIGNMINTYETRNGHPPELEALVYARHELMAMQHCIVYNALGERGCGHCKKERFNLEDISGSRFPVLTDDHCNNYILNCRPLQPDISALLALGIRHFRIEFYDENAQECVSLVHRYLRMIER